MNTISSGAHLRQSQCPAHDSRLIRRQPAIEPTDVFRMAQVAPAELYSRLAALSPSQWEATLDAAVEAVESERGYMDGRREAFEAAWRRGIARLGGE